MADPVKLVERIAARGRRKLEKRTLDAQRVSPEEARRRKALAEVEAKRARREAEYEIKRVAILADYEAVQARRIERQRRAALKGPPTTEQILAKQRRTANQHARKLRRIIRAQQRLSDMARIQIDREARQLKRAAGAQERAAALAAKEAIQAAKREMAAIKRRASRLPPLSYSNAPPLPY